MPAPIFLSKNLEVTKVFRTFTPDFDFNTKNHTPHEVDISPFTPVVHALVGSPFVHCLWR